MKQHSDEPSVDLSWNRHDTVWMLSLFGTAVGAGILFLPINAGMGGFWTLVIMTIFVGPMTYMAHRGLARFVCSSDDPTGDITHVAEEHFGHKASLVLTWVYFCAIFPILLVYGVGITNTVESFIVHQMGWKPPSRVFLSMGLILGLVLIMAPGERLMLRITQWLVYPLAAILLCLSIFLIPHWNTDAISVMPKPLNVLTTLWITMPVLVFSFNHSPAISQFSVAQKREYGPHAADKASQILKRTSAMLMLFVMFFVFSCVLSLSPEQLAEAKQQNLPILSYLANSFDSPFISYFGPLIAAIAIVSSFFGHYLGAREGLYGLVTRYLRESDREYDGRVVHFYITIFMLVSVWGVATLNPSILAIIEILVGPVIAAILFLMPMYAIHRVPALSQYRNRWSNVFVTIMGCIAISAIIYHLYHLYM